MAKLVFDPKVAHMVVVSEDETEAATGTETTTPVIAESEQIKLLRSINNKLTFFVVLSIIAVLLSALLR